MIDVCAVLCHHAQDRIVACCLEKGIAVYSPHTAYDTLKGGVNDWLLKAFGELRDIGYLLLLISLHTLTVFVHLTFEDL
ncbi:NIF3-like protein 1 [Portunus trituberculatus]|uniref:NIF3-like protein 1 n=1 Tax=Portunus trituberculatus TaxID=210409 RepID=A0A5B7J4R9_PORTR|nr:NIF3-like protein 1 [Portunus trituberculatus]